VREASNEAEYESSGGEAVFYSFALWSGCWLAVPLAFDRLGGGGDPPWMLMYAGFPALFSVLAILSWRWEESQREPTHRTSLAPQLLITCSWATAITLGWALNAVGWLGTATLVGAIAVAVAISTSIVRRNAADQPVRLVVAAAGLGAAGGIAGLTVIAAVDGTTGGTWALLTTISLGGMLGTFAPRSTGRSQMLVPLLVLLAVSTTSAWLVTGEFWDLANEVRVRGHPLGPGFRTMCRLVATLGVAAVWAQPERDVGRHAQRTLLAVLLVPASGSLFAVFGLWRAFWNHDADLARYWEAGFFALGGGLVAWWLRPRSTGDEIIPPDAILANPASASSNPEA
jgi:hypothetical protein